jgi:hypothetical protein
MKYDDATCRMLISFLIIILFAVLTDLRLGSAAKVAVGLLRQTTDTEVGTEETRALFVNRWTHVVKKASQSPSAVLYERPSSADAVAQFIRLARRAEAGASEFF